MQKNMQQASPFPQLDWQSRKLISTGSYSKVYRANSLDSKNQYAIKVTDLTTAQSQQDQLSIATEIEVLRRVKSDHVVQIYDYKIQDKKSFILLQNCESSLKNFIERNRSKIPQQQCIKILTHIIFGLKALIDQQFLHCDIKPANILHKNGIWKLCDFGFAKKFSQIQDPEKNQFNGTPAYMAPQILKGVKFTSKCQIWSLGMVYYQLLYGFPPWPYHNIPQFTKSICQKKVAFPSLGKKVSQNSKNFIERCLQSEEKNRMSWQQMLSHPLISKSFEFDRETVEKQLVNPVLQCILSQIQEEVRKNRININLIFERYSHYFSLKFPKFWELLNEVNQTITTYQSDFLFKLLDRDQDQQISLNQLEVLLADIDHKDCNDILKKELQDIIGLMQSRNININQLFQQIDTDRNGSIDRKQFDYFLSKIAPQLGKKQKEVLFKQFDIDKNGVISQQEFLRQVSFGVMKRRRQNTCNAKNMRAQRNLHNIRIFMKYSGLTIQQLMRVLDENCNGKIQINELRELLDGIGYIISDEQVQQIFSGIDTDNSKHIQIDQLMQFLC